MVARADELLVDRLHVPNRNSHPGIMFPLHGIPYQAYMVTGIKIAYGPKRASYCYIGGSQGI